jgi:hypothetical protein
MKVDSGAITTAVSYVLYKSKLADVPEVTGSLDHPVS